MTDTIPNSITSHVVIVISTFIGHIRPHSNLCFNLLKLHKGMYITLIHHAIHNEVVATELKRQELEEDVTKRLNIVSMGTAVGFNLDPVVEMPGCMAELAMGFPAAYANSFNLKRIPNPTFVGCDVIIAHLIAESKVKVDLMQPVQIAIPMYLTSVVPAGYVDNQLAIWYPVPLSPEDASHPSRAMIPELWPAKKDTMTQGDIFENIFAVESEPIKATGYPEMYPREIIPTPPGLIYLGNCVETWLGVSQVFQHIGEGLIFLEEAEFEPEAVESLRAKVKKPIYMLGPQFCDAFWAGKEDKPREIAIGEGSNHLSSFLDAKLASEGENSVLYISFGSTSFPKVESHFVALFETIFSMEPKIPFIFSYDPKQIKLPESLVKRLNESMKAGDAIITQWCPQQYILSHPATGWFLSHGGSGSLAETINAGVPQIMWPVAYDQPAIAAQMSLTHDAAFELINTRTGVNVGKPTARGVMCEGTDEALRKEMKDVFERMRGEEGERKRRNMLGLREKYRKSRESGLSRKAMEEVGKIGLTGSSQ